MTEQDEKEQAAGETGAAGGSPQGQEEAVPRAEAAEQTGEAEPDEQNEQPEEAEQAARAEHEALSEQTSEASAPAQTSRAPQAEQEEKEQIEHSQGAEQETPAGQEMPHEQTSGAETSEQAQAAEQEEQAAGVDQEKKRLSDWSKLPRNPLSKRVMWIGVIISLLLYLGGFYLASRVSHMPLEGLAGAELQSVLMQQSLANGLTIAGAVALGLTLVILLVMDYRHNREWYRRRFKR